MRPDAPTLRGDVFWERCAQLQCPQLLGSSVTERVALVSSSVPTDSVRELAYANEPEQLQLMLNALTAVSPAISGSLWHAVRCAYCARTVFC